MAKEDTWPRALEHLAELVDGTAPDSINEIVAGDDELRDLRHDARHAADTVAHAADDYEPPSDLESRLASALQARTPAAPPKETDPTGPALASTASRTAAVPFGSGADSEPRERRFGKLPWIVGGGGLVAAAAAAGMLLFTGVRGDRNAGTNAHEAWHGEVTLVSGAGGAGKLTLCRRDDSDCRSAKPGDTVPAGSHIKTDERTRAHLRLKDGTRLSLDRSTSLALDDSKPRAAQLKSGAIVADVSRRDDQRATIGVPLGRINVLGTKFALRSDDRAASVDVSRGAVELVDMDARTVTVLAGEEGRLESGSAPVSASSQALAEAMAWSDSLVEELRASELGRGLGELRAKKPGEEQERTKEVALTSHRVKVRIAGAVARTEVEEVFTNHTHEVLEGIFRFPLPPDAKIERLALEVDGKLEEGAFVDRERAAAIWRGSIVNAAPQLKDKLRDEIIWVPGPWRDPALLEWQRGNRFELRIFPIPKNGSRRIILAYTQVVKPAAGVRRYTYPLAHDPENSTRVGEFAVDVEVRGHDPKHSVRSAGYETAVSEAAPNVHRLTLSERNFVPRGDLVVEYAQPEAKRGLVAWAYQPSGNQKTGGAPQAAEASAQAADDTAPYLAMALRPNLPRTARDERRAYAFVVDRSRSMLGENLRRAAEVTARIIRELPSEDSVTVLACDAQCDTYRRGAQAPDATMASDIQRWLTAQNAEGASDLTGAVRAGAEALGSERGRSRRVVYVGDGTPTLGPVRASTIATSVRGFMRDLGATVTAVAIGGDSDLESLRAVARGGAGVVLPYVPGSTAVEAAYAALGATYGRALTDVRLELPPGLTEVAPERLENLAAGDEAVIVARMTRPRVSGTVVLRGVVGTEPFEARYPLDVEAASGPANGFVPRLYAATRIVDLERKGDADSKQRAIELSSRFDVASRYTSLLVLESPAMFRAFGLDNQRSFPEWTGEEETQEASAEAESEPANESSASAKVAVSGGSGPSSSGARQARSSSRARESASAPAPKPIRSRCGCARGDLKCEMRCAANESSSPRPSYSPPANAAEAAPSTPQFAQPPPMDIAADVEPTRPPSPPPRGRRSWIPMRRTWVRSGEFDSSRTTPRVAGVKEISAAERHFAEAPESREALRKLYVLYALSGDLARAGDLAERWSTKDPLDPGALTARADLAARKGDRETAIRILGSVVDVRPSDVGAQERLARLYRWSAKPALGCRFLVALAEFRPDDARVLTEAVRCSQDTQDRVIGELLLQSAKDDVRARVEKLLASGHKDEMLSGDFRIEARWDGDVDVDLSLLHPDGHRVSWLGAPTRSVITATDVLSLEREGLALRGATPGEYVVEVVRGEGSGPVSGTLDITIGQRREKVRFTLDDARQAVGVARVSLTEHLVRAW